MRTNKKYWRPLGAIAILLGCLALIYAIMVLIHDHSEPLIGVFLALVAIPAILPAVFGYFMWQGKVWAAWGLRISISGMLLCGAFLDLILGLDVLSFPQLAIPLIVGSVVWLVLSFI